MEPRPPRRIVQRLAAALKDLFPHRSTILLLFLGVAVPLVVFGMLADDVRENEQIVFDMPIQTFVHQQATATLDAFMLALSRMGSAWCTVPFDVLAAIVLVLRGRLRLAAFWLVAVAGAAALDGIAKHFYGRERPALWASPAPETTFSFPSGHAMHTAAIVAALVVLVWDTPWRLPALMLGGLFAFGVGLSRIYLGVHYPSDVLAGWLAALGWVVGLTTVSRVNARRAG